MIDSIVNSRIVLFSLVIIVIASLIWHFIENRWDKRIFEKDRKGIFKNLHTKAALYAYDHVDGLIPVDVRSKQHFNDSRIPGAVNAVYNDHHVNPTELNSIDRDSPILLYCEGGFASRRAIDRVKDLGFNTIYHLHRGFKSWQFFGGAVESHPD